MNSLSDIIRYEFNRISRRPLFILGAVIAPLLIAILIPSIYANRTMQKIPSAIIDRDQSETSRLFTRLLNQHRYIDIVKHASSQEECRNDFYKNKLFILIEIPEGFEKDLKSGKQPTISVSDYGSNLVIANIAYKAFLETITTLNGYISAKYLAASRGESAFTFSQFPPVTIDFNNLYNPAFSYLIFLPPAALIALFQMLIILLASILIAGDWAWVKSMRKRGIRWMTILTGKSIPLVSIMLAWGVVLYGILTLIFAISFKAGFGYFTLYWVVFIIVSTGLGLFFSLLFTDEMMATEASVFITAPAFAFSGYTYPMWELPTIHQWFAALMPSTYFIPLFTQVIIQGSPFHNHWLFLGKIMLYGIVLLVLLTGTVKFKDFQMAKEG